MKRKIKVVGIDGKALEGEVKMNGKDHLAAQIKYRANVIKDKTKYTRKKKHKKNYLSEN